MGCEAMSKHARCNISNARSKSGLADRLNKGLGTRRILSHGARRVRASHHFLERNLRFRIWNSRPFTQRHFPYHSLSIVPAVVTPTSHPSLLTGEDRSPLHRPVASK